MLRNPIILKSSKDVMILDFFKTAANLKEVPRQGWIEKLAIMNPESVADHSYSVAVMCMIMSDVKGCNSERILKMALLHDLAESKIGDYTPNQIPKAKKMQMEDDALFEILNQLPDAMQSAYQEIWQEYKENSSDESRLLHQIDKLEMALQAKTYQNDVTTTTQHDIESFLKTAKDEITDPKLSEMLDALEK